MKRICIVGSGAAGLLLLYNLEKANVDPQSITVIDPTHTGGDLSKKWSCVRSNTTWRQIFEAVPSRTSFASPWSQLNPEEPVELQYVIEYLREVTRDYLSKTILRTARVVSAVQDGEVWKLSLSTGKQELVFDRVFFCQGSEPKILDLPFPSIPLEIAFDPRRLETLVKPGAHILVFGTAHSGPIVVKNLVDRGAKVTNFYATDAPFLFERDGHYDGIKKDAAGIAQDILSGVYPTVSLESVHDLSAVLRASKTADACVYACGFEPRCISPQVSAYDGRSGRIQGSTTAWGFGIAYPNRAPDGVHWDVPEDSKSSGQSPKNPKGFWDVSVPAFQAHIQAQMPEILASLQ